MEGTSQLEVTIGFESEKYNAVTSSDKTLVFRVSSKACPGPDAPATTFPAVLFNDEPTSKVEMTREVGTPASTTYTSDPLSFEVTDFEEAQSLVVLQPGGGGPIACVDLIVALPDFPETHSVTLEATISNKGYTFTRHEAYSHIDNKVRMDADILAEDGTPTHVEYIQDFTSNQVIEIIRPTAAKPYGQCVVKDADFLMGINGNEEGLKPAREFYGINNEIEHVPHDPDNPNHIVRGVPCNVWREQVALTDPPGNAVATYYFQISSWNDGEDRMPLKRVTLKGTGDRSAMSHNYEYINLKTELESWATLNVCETLPFGENCGCGDPADASDADDAGGSDNRATDTVREGGESPFATSQRATGTRDRSTSPFAGGSSGTTDGSRTRATDDSEGDGEGDVESCDNTHKFVKEQAGAYLFFIFTGLLLGALIGSLVACCIAKRRGPAHGAGGGGFTSDSALPTGGRTGGLNEQDSMKALELVNENPAYGMDNNAAYRA